MKYIYLILLPLFIFADTDIISEKEAFQSEDDIYWYINKEIQVKDGLKIPLLFEFTKRGLGSLKLKDGMWLPIYDCNDNGGTRYKPCMIHQLLKDINNDGFLDIYLTTELYQLQEGAVQSFVPLKKIFAELLYNPDKHEYYLSKHSSGIETYVYYED